MTAVLPCHKKNTLPKSIQYIYNPNEKANLLPVTERERQDLQAFIGSLQCASANTRPDLSSRLSFLQSDINKATIETLIPRKSNSP